MLHYDDSYYLDAAAADDDYAGFADDYQFADDFDFCPLKQHERINYRDDPVADKNLDEGRRRSRRAAAGHYRPGDGLQTRPGGCKCRRAACLDFGFSGPLAVP